MTYTEFRNKWIGKGIDFDGKFGFQCVDVYRMYCKEVLEIPQSPSVVGAKDIWDTYLRAYFEKIENTLTAVPEQGDVIIWNVGTYGHIAICDSANIDSFISFEQNWTHLDGTGVTELRTHQYKDVLGWLRPIKGLGQTMTEEQKRILDFIGTRTEGDVREAFGALADSPNKDGMIKNLQEQVVSLGKFVTNLETRVMTLDGELQDKLKLVADWQSEVETAKENLQTAEEALALMTTEKNNYKKWYEAKCDELKKLDSMTALQHIFYGIKKLFVK